MSPPSLISELCMPATDPRSSAGGGSVELCFSVVAPLAHTTRRTRMPGFSGGFDRACRFVCWWSNDVSEEYRCARAGVLLMQTVKVTASASSTCRKNITFDMLNKRVTRHESRSSSGCRSFTLRGTRPRVAQRWRKLKLTLRRTPSFQILKGNAIFCNRASLRCSCRFKWGTLCIRRNSGSVMGSLQDFVIELPLPVVRIVKGVMPARTRMRSLPHTASMEVAMIA